MESSETSIQDARCLAIRQVLLHHPQVAAASVVRRYDPMGKETLIASVQPCPGITLNPVELVSHCIQHLPAGTPLGEMVLVITQPSSVDTQTGAGPG